MKRALFVLLLCGIAPAGTHAQSLFAARGLGIPVEPIDSRARLLGGVGVGLLGVNPSLVNPAELAAVRRGVTAVLQPASHTLRVDGAEEDVGSTRFPLLSLLYPISERLLLGVGYGGYLEQSWAVRTSGTLPIGDGLDYEDVVRSRGGLSQVRLTAAYSISPGLSIGAAAGLLTGNLDRSLARTFADTATTLPAFSTRLRWKYSGALGAFGAQWQPMPALRIAASLALTTDIDADSAAGAARPRSYGSAMIAAAGASGQITPDLLLALGATRQRFPGIDSGAELSRETWAFGGGLEYSGLRSGRRSFPLRVGGRVQELPYHAVGETPAREISGGLGLGFRLAADASGPLAVLDTGLERARRTGLSGETIAGGIEESVWRWTFSLSLFGR
ncbi:MAG TPA: hypothetical protein VK939_12595 [Longimicrobiales bacterium]|nr:hypothetical protein [Longimicrobiales bacterium]